MRRRLLCQAGLAAISSAALSYRAISAAGPAAQQAERAARAASDAEVQGFLRNDIKRLDQLWGDDMVVTNPLNRFVHKQDVLGMMRSGFLVITSYERRIEYAHTYGDLVVFAGSETVVFGGRMPVVGKPQQLRFTALWTRREGRWQQVVRHANVVPAR